VATPRSREKKQGPTPPPNFPEYLDFVNLNRPASLEKEKRG
jgi:hypothetical protein